MNFDVLKKSPVVALLKRIILFGIVIFSFSVYFSEMLLGVNLPGNYTGLDPSYVWAFDDLETSRHSPPPPRAAQTAGKLYWGKDMTGPHGPYGYLLWGHHYKQSIAFSLAIIGLFAALIIFNYRKNIFSLEKLALFSVLTLLFSSFASFEWRFNLFLFVLCASIWRLKDDKRLLYVLSALLGFLSSFALLLKFNTAVLALALAFLLCLFLFLSNRRQGVHCAVIFALSYLVFLARHIPVFFQNIPNFITWITMSIEVARGFSEAMVTEGPQDMLLQAWIVIIMYIFFSFQKESFTSGFFVIPVLGFIPLFFAYKHGFVRQDGHMLSFFTTIPFLTGFVYLFAGKKTAMKHLLLFIGAVIIADAGLAKNWNGSTLKHSYMVMKDTAKNIIRFPQKITSYPDTKNANLAPDILPASWNEVIGDNSIQILPWELSYAGANNWTGWMPNPLFELCNGYTKKLDEYSASSFDKDRMPVFVLLEYMAIDGRNMLLDTPATMNALTQNYHVIKSDGRRLLLQKNTDYKTLTLNAKETQTCHFNETVLAPPSKQQLYAAINIKPSLPGKIITALFRNKPCEITARYQNGEERTFRIIADTLRNPVLLSYLPNDFGQMKRSFFDIYDDDFAVKEFELKGSSLFYTNNITIDWFESAQPLKKASSPQPIGSVNLSNTSSYATNDIIDLTYKNGQLIIHGGVSDPFVIMPLPEAFIYPQNAVDTMLTLTYSNDTQGQLQIFYDYGAGYNEADSTGRYMVSKTGGENGAITLPLTGWDTDRNLKGIRIDPPDGSVFSVISIELLGVFSKD